MAVTRVNCAGMDVEKAIRKTLENGFCHYPKLISDTEFNQLQQQVNNKITHHDANKSNK